MLSLGVSEDILLSHGFTVHDSFQKMKRDVQNRQMGMDGHIQVYTHTHTHTHTHTVEGPTWGKGETVKGHATRAAPGSITEPGFSFTS